MGNPVIAIALAIVRWKAFRNWLKSNKLVAIIINEKSFNVIIILGMT